MDNGLSKMYLCAIKDIEKRIGKSMTENQKQGLWNCGTGMFMEAALHGFYCAKTDEAVEVFLKEIDGFTRGEQVLNRPDQEI